MSFDSEKISTLLKNSLKNEDNRKPDRLDGKNFSFQEAETNFTKSGQDIGWRIIIGLDNSKALIVEDWRHLLEAYRQLSKEIPDSKITFSSKKAKQIFYKLIE